MKMSQGVRIVPNLSQPALLVHTLSMFQKSPKLHDCPVCGA